MLFLWSCNFVDRRIGKDYYEEAFDSVAHAKAAEMDSICNIILVTGDTTNLERLHAYYKGIGHEVRILPYYMILADRYKNRDCCLKAYEMFMKYGSHYPGCAEKALTYKKRYEETSKIRH